MTGIRITRNNLINVAIQSVKERSNLSMFWDYVNAAKSSGLLKLTDIQIRLLLDRCDIFVHDKGFELQEQEKRLPDHTKVYANEFWRDGRTIEGDALDNLMSKVKDITLLKTEIPNYMDVFAPPKPLKVYLIDDMVFWPLFKVVGMFGRSNRSIGQLYLLGRDRHTRQPFALGIPNGFIDMPFEACLRWTLDAHTGDTVIEV